MMGTAIASDLTAAGKTGVALNAIYDFWTPSRHYQAFHGGMRLLTESASARHKRGSLVRADRRSIHSGWLSAISRSRPGAAASPSAPKVVEITGTEGVVTIPLMWLPPRRATWVVQRDEREPQEHAVEGADQIVEMLDDFSGAVLRGEPVHPNPSEAVRTMKVLDALARSAREEREVAV